MPTGVTLYESEGWIGLPLWSCSWAVTPRTMRLGKGAMMVGSGWKLLLYDF